MIKDIVKDVFQEIISSDTTFVDRCMAIVVALCLILAVVLIGTLLFFLVDCVGINATQTTTATVSGKTIKPAYTTPMMVGKIMTIQYHPESYRLQFKVGEREISYSTKKDFFGTINVGDQIHVTYGLTRFSDEPYPTEIRLVKEIEVEK